MRIGLVYDLRDDYRALGLSEEEIAEFDNIDTIDQLAGALEALGCEVTRVGRGQALAARLVAGERFDIVFTIAEGVKGRSREAQVPALCELLGIPYTGSDSATLAIALDKALTKKVLKQHGILTPEFQLFESWREKLNPALKFPLIVKPNAEGSSKGIASTSVVDDEPALRELLKDCISRYKQPALCEEFISGREFTVGLLGDRRSSSSGRARARSTTSRSSRSGRSTSSTTARPSSRPPRPRRSSAPPARASLPSSVATSRAWTCA
jgi:D-alanine-D-alanine ligase